MKDQKGLPFASLFHCQLNAADAGDVKGRAGRRWGPGQVHPPGFPPEDSVCSILRSCHTVVVLALSGFLGVCGGRVNQVECRVRRDSLQYYLADMSRPSFECIVGTGRWRLLVSL